MIKDLTFDDLEKRNLYFDGNTYCVTRLCYDIVHLVPLNNKVIKDLANSLLILNEKKLKKREKKYSEVNDIKVINNNKIRIIVQYPTHYLCRVILGSRKTNRNSYKDNYNYLIHKDNKIWLPLIKKYITNILNKKGLIKEYYLSFDISLFQIKSLNIYVDRSIYYQHHPIENEDDDKLWENDFCFHDNKKNIDINMVPDFDGIYASVDYAQHNIKTYEWENKYLTKYKENYEIISLLDLFDN